MKPDSPDYSGSERRRSLGSSAVGAAGIRNWIPQHNFIDPSETIDCGRRPGPKEARKVTDNGDIRVFDERREQYVGM